MVTTTPATETKDELDPMLIGALVCCGLGAILILIGIFRLIAYACNSRDDKKARERYLRQLEHIRRVEEYSLRTGAAPDEFLVKSSSPRSMAGASNGAYYWDDNGSSVGAGTTHYVIQSSNGHAPGLPVLISPQKNDLNRHSGSLHPDTIIIDDSRSSIRGADLQF